MALQSHIDASLYDFVDFSMVGASGSGKSTRSFSITNDAASFTAQTVVRFGSLLGFGGFFNDALAVSTDIKSINASVPLSAIAYDSTHASASDVKSDGIAAVGSVQAFSEYCTLNPVFIFQMTVQSSDPTQLSKDIAYQYFKEDLSIIPSRKLTQSSTLINRPNGNNSDVNIFTTKELGGLYLSSMNYLEFTSLKGKDFTVNFDIGAIAVIGQMKILL
jgi:hypothetical protein